MGLDSRGQGLGWVCFALGVLSLLGLGPIPQLGKLRHREWQGLHHSFMSSRSGEDMKQRPSRAGRGVAGEPGGGGPDLAWVSPGSQLRRDGADFYLPQEFAALGQLTV